MIRFPKARRRWIVAVVCGLALPAAAHRCPADPATATSRPNVVVILCDDLGYGDMHCNNPKRSKIPTPHFDRLASGGMRFTDGHSSSGVCSPSRYTLLTGRYHWRTRLQAGIVGVFGSPLIAPDRLTIAGLARRQGYRTACVGKWHLGWDWPMAPGQSQHFQGIANRPVGPGGLVDRATDAERAAWRDVFNRPIGGGPTTRGFERYFGTDVPNWPPYCFLEDDRTIGVPSELLPAALFAPNLASLQGPALAGWKLEPILPALGDRACSLLDAWARKREPFLLYLPLTSPHTPLAVNAAWRGKSGLNPYADFVMETDALVGRVLDALDRNGLSDNTLVLLTSDNGCAPYIGAKQLEARGHYPSGPLRGYKGDAWEGGHRVPFVVRWPGVVSPASTCGQLVQQADILATLADVFGVRLPANAGEDSFSFLPLLQGADRPIRQSAVNCSAGGVFTIRQGSCKAIFQPGPGAQRTQLFDLAGDIGESTDRAAEQPELVAELSARMEKTIADGRSTPGAPQSNDVRVDWNRSSPRGGKAKPRGKP